MEDSKTLLFYLLSFAGLIVVSIMFTGRIEQPEIEAQQPAIVLPTTTKVKSTTNALETDQELCASINQMAFYTPDLTHLEGNRLVISGTLYASDFVTPLSNTPIEVWLAAQEVNMILIIPPIMPFTIGSKLTRLATMKSRPLSRAIMG